MCHSRWWPLNETRCVADEQYGLDLKVEEGSADYKELMKLVEKGTKIADKKSTLVDAVNQALAGCTTYKQVQENYPSLAGFLPKIEPQTKALAVTDDKVKAALNSKPKAKVKEAACRPRNCSPCSPAWPGRRR
jgi:hypothetical protein